MAGASSQEKLGHLTATEARMAAQRVDTDYYLVRSCVSVFQSYALKKK